MDVLGIFTKSPVFDQVDHSALRSLIPSGKEIILKKEEILFHQGDPSRSVYVVLAGRILAILEGDQQSQVVSDILPGDIIGEVTMLTQEKRTMTVMAVIPSILLEFSKEIMTEFSVNHPRVLINIVNILAKRATQTLKLLSTHKINRHLAIINLLQDNKYTEFFLSFKKTLHDIGGSSIAIKQFSREMIHINNYPDFLKYLMSESNKAEVFHELNLEQIFLSRSLVENAVEEIIFVPADADPTVFSHYNSIGNIRHLKKYRRRSLVLIHDSHVKLPHNTLRWLQAGKFTAHYHVRIDRQADRERLVRFLLRRANGLVISGGAARSMIGMGTIKALFEKQMPIDAVGGTSMGAVLGGLFLLSEDYPSFEKYCNYIISGSKYWNKLRSLTWPLISLYSGSSSTNELKKACGSVRIEDLWQPFFAVTCNYSDSVESIHTQGFLWEILRATIALPGLLPPCVINGKIYMDGAMMNNFPVDIMRHKVGKKGLIIGVNSFTPDDQPIHYKFPPSMPFLEALFTKLRWRNKDYIYPSIFDIVAKSLFVSSIHRQIKNRRDVDMIVQPDVRHYHFSDFKYYKNLMMIGYQEMLKILNAKKII